MGQFTHMYGTRWRRTRAGYLARHPLCVVCGREGRVTAATVVDHITPHRGDMAMFWARDNWQPLCAGCHNRKTAAEDGGFGNAPGRATVSCGADGWPIDRF